MLEITVRDCEETTRTVAFDDFNENGRPMTIGDVCNNQALLDQFEGRLHDGESLADYLDDWNGCGIGSSNRARMLRAAVESGDELTFDVEFAPEGEAAVDENGQAPASNDGQSGTVTVYTAGGINSFSVPVINGRTTVQEVVFSDTTRQRSGMNDTLLSNCVIAVNDAETTNMAQTLRDGDIVNLNLRTSKTGGRR